MVVSWRHAVCLVDVALLLHYLLVLDVLGSRKSSCSLADQVRDRVVQERNGYHLLSELLELLRVRWAQDSLHGPHGAHHLLLSLVSHLPLLLLLLLLGPQVLLVLLLSRTAVSGRHAAREAGREFRINQGVWQAEESIRKCIPCV